MPGKPLGIHGFQQLWPYNPRCGHRISGTCVADHLEPVTARVNTLRGESFAAKNARKTHCRHGHAFTEDNTYITPKLERQCRACLRAAKKRYLETRSIA